MTGEPEDYRTGLPGIQTDGLRSREPFEVSLLVFAAIVGFATLIALLPTPPSIAVQTRVFGDVFWTGGLVVGSFLALGGIWWPQTPHAVKTMPLLFEQVGLVVVAGASFVYAVSLLATNGLHAFYAAGLNIAFAVPALIQGRRIQKRLNNLKQAP